MAPIRNYDECHQKRFSTERFECAARVYFSEPACAAAFTELERTYYYRKGYDAYPLHRLLNACGRAYCPRLPAPRPRLCEDLPVGPNPAGWFHGVDPLLEAIDKLEGESFATPMIELRSKRAYCRAGAAHGLPSEGVTLRLRRLDGRYQVRAEGALTGAWTFDDLGGAAARPLVEALYARRFRGEISILLEGVLPAKAFGDLTGALYSAGWCRVVIPTAPHDAPGGLSCPLAWNRPLRQLAPRYDGGPLGTVATVRVTPTALYYQGRRVVRLENGRVPGRFLTDGPEGHLIHPLRKAIGADHPSPGIPDAVRIVVTPGVTVSTYLIFSITYSANQALAQATRDDRHVLFSVRCQ